MASIIFDADSSGTNERTSKRGLMARDSFCCTLNIAFSLKTSAWDDCTEAHKGAGNLGGEKCSSNSSSP